MVLQTRFDVLDKNERKALRRCETIIKRGVRTFIEVGTALEEIQERQLYRDDHETFEDYCGNRWQLSRAHAYRLIESAKVVVDVGDEENGPATESQARPLTKIKDAEVRQQLWDKAKEAAGEEPITAKIVDKVVKEHLTENPDDAKTPQTSKTKNKDIAIERAKTAGAGVDISSQTSETDAADDLSLAKLEIDNDQGGLACWVWRPLVKKDLRVELVKKQLSAPMHSAPPRDRPAADECSVIVSPDIDLFTGGISPEDRKKIIAAMAQASHWTFLLATREYQTACGYDYPENVWLGARVGSNADLETAEHAFAGARAATKFLLCSPLAEPLELASTAPWNWVVVCGSDPMPSWDSLWKITYQSAERGVPVFWTDDLFMRPTGRPAQ